MKKTCAVAGLAAMMFALCGLCLAQAKDAPKTVTSILDGGIKSVEGEFFALLREQVKLNYQPQISCLESGTGSDEKLQDLWQ